MNKFFTKVASLCVGLAMAAGVGVAVGSVKAEKVKAAESLEYTLDFKANSTDTDNSTALGTTVSDYFDDGASYVASVSSSKVYLGKSSMNGIKFGSSSAKGTLILTLSGTGQVKASKITLALAMYDSGKNVNVSINGATSGTGYSQLSPGTTLSDYDVEWDGSTNLSTIKVEANIASKCRFYLDYIKVYTNGGSSCEHNWVAGTVHAPTCTEQGYTEYECSICEATKQDDVVAALGHDYGDVIVDTAATCTEDGAGHKVCSRDSSHIENVVIPATGHNFVNGICSVCGAEEPSETTISLDFTSNSYGISSTQGNQTLTGDGATYGFEFGKGTGTGAKANSGYILFGKAGVYFRNTSAPANSYISAIGWTYSGNVSTNVQLSLSYGSSVLSAESSPITSFGKATQNGEVSLTQTDTTNSYFFIYVTNAYNCQWKSFTVTWSSKGGDTPGSTYSVTYEANGSSSRPVEGMPSNITGLEDGETATLTGSPTRWGYSFLGWGASASATETISSVTIDGDNETVYALWQEDHNVAGAWSDSPYTVAQARAAIDAASNVADVYATGIVSEIVTAYSSQYKNISFNISEDGSTTANQLEVFRCVGSTQHPIASDNDIEVGATVVAFGSLTKYNSTYEFAAGCTVVDYTGPSTGDIEVTFQPSLFLGVGDNGTYTASTEAENPTYSFSSDNASVLSVESNGAYTAVATGSATVRVDVTSSDGDGFKEVTVNVVAVKTVSEAYEIAEGLASGATTDYSIKVSGAISSLDADGKARAINFTDGSQVIEVFFGGGNADYTTVKNNGVIGSKVTVFGKVQNYSGTYELKDITLAGVVGGDADSYAAGAYKSLDGSCETGPAAVTEDQWTAVSNGYSALSLVDQAKFRDADLTPHGENVVNWVDRYERIVSQTELANFMSLSNIAGRLAFGSNGVVDSDSAMIIVIIAAVTSLTSIAVLLVIKRRKTLVK